MCYQKNRSSKKGVEVKGEEVVAKEEEAVEGPKGDQDGPRQICYC